MTELVIHIFAGLVIGIIPVQSDRCGAVWQALLDEPRIQFGETYTNETWGFALTIPAGMTAYSQASPPYHGVWFTLGDPPHGSIVVTGRANSLEFKTPAGAAREQIRMLRDGGKRIKSDSMSSTRLVRLPATRLETRYSCSGDPTKYVEVYVVVLSPQKDPLYELTLRTTVDRLPKDLPLFERILGSWKFIGR